ncbi:MAG TPA: hypothetical protein DEB39_10215 [Planctomycetaceae bacterium]|nr:hypothetical protein [Planctomycetaceae bacterium]
MRHSCKGSGGLYAKLVSQNAELAKSMNSHHLTSNWQFCVSNTVGILGTLATFHVAGFFGKQ